MSKQIKAGGAYVTLGVQDKLAQGLQAASSKLKNFAGSAASVAAPLAAMSGGLFAALGAPTRLASEFENAGVAFTTMLGSAERAKKLMGDIVTLSAATPYEQGELIDASKSLLAFGSTAEEIPGQLTKIGDIASGVGAPIGELSEIFGKAKVAGTLFSEDINQLVGRGVPVIQEFAKQLGVAEGEVKKMASEGKISFEMLETAFDSLTSKGGKFAGMMQAQSRTTAGKWSTLKDGVSVTLREIGQTLLPLVNQVMDFASQLIASFQPFLPVVAAAVPAIVAVGAALAGVSGALLTVAGGAAAFAWVLGLVAPVATLAAGIGAVTAAVWMMRDELQPVLDWMGQGFQWLADTATKAWGGISDALAAGDLALAGQIAMAGLKLAFTAGLESLAGVFGASVQQMSAMLAAIWKQFQQVAARLNSYRAEASQWIAEALGAVVGVEVLEGDNALLDSAAAFEQSVNAIDVSKLADNISSALDPEQYRQEMENLIAKASEARQAMEAAQAQDALEVTAPEIRKAQSAASKSLSDATFDSVGSFGANLLSRMLPQGRSIEQKQLDVSKQQLKTLGDIKSELSDAQPLAFQ
jgi:tape measure domain-containing protein